MKIYAIRKNQDINAPAYLFYYERSREFFIEINDGFSEWDMPMILDSFHKKGVKSVGPYWSMAWVQQRIVPRDRQNIGQILKENGLKNYDEHALLTLVSGRCEQDDYYLEEISEEEIPETISERQSRHVVNIAVFSKLEMVVFFRDGSIKKCSFENFIRDNKEFGVLANRSEYFARARVMTDGYGIWWDENLWVDFETVYKMSKEQLLSTEIIENYMMENIMTTNDVMEELNCSRQYVSELVNKGILKPFRSEGKTTLFLRTDIMRYLWK